MKQENAGDGAGKLVLMTLGIFFFGQMVMGSVNLWNSWSGYRQAAASLEQRKAFVGKYVRVQGTLEGLVRDLVQADAAGNKNVKTVLENAKINIDVKK